MRRRPSTATVVAFMALLLALGGTSWAAVTITGKSVKDSSLTGKDVKDKSLTPKDFKGSLRGPRGTRGATGPAGATGPTGPQGVSGVANVTRLEVATGFEDDPLLLGVDPVLVSEAGTFVKNAAASRIKLTWNGRIHGEGVGDWFCDFQVRIDGNAAGGDGGRGVVFANADLERDVSVSVTAFFGGVSAGTHAVDVYVRANPGMTNRCATAEGGFEDEIYVEEMPG